MHETHRRAPHPVHRFGSRFSPAQRLTTFMMMSSGRPIALPLGSPPYSIVRSHHIASGVQIFLTPHRRKRRASSGKSCYLGSRSLPLCCLPLTLDGRFWN